MRCSRPGTALASDRRRGAGGRQKHSMAVSESVVDAQRQADAVKDMLEDALQTGAPFDPSKVAVLQPKLAR
eukprot:2006715-Rhodomonas_salina.3